MLVKQNNNIEKGEPMKKRYSLGSYTLTDNQFGRTYTTGVSLADCTIPFEELLNRLNNYVDYYKEERDTLVKKNKILQEQLDQYETLLQKFEELYDSSVEAMVRAEEVEY